MARLDRTNFYNKFGVNGINESDLVYNHWDLFTLTRPVIFCQISRSFIGRPDLISYKYFGIIDYWWIILKVNEIDDPWNDLIMGNQIIIPDANDIEDWILAIKKFKRDKNG